MSHLFTILIITTLTNTITSRIIKPSTSDELRSALTSASPGDTIQMLPMHYKGDFIIPANSGPATLIGDGNTTIESEEGGGQTGLLVQGSGWKIKSFWIKGPIEGCVVEGNQNSIEGVVIQTTTNAMVIKGEENMIKSCVISEAELGIILEASKNSLYYNSVNIQTPAIIIKAGTCCGLLNGNVANGEMNLDGDEYKLVGNVANHGLYIKGCKNELMGNVANGARFPDNCEQIDLGGNVYRGLGPGDTDLPNPNQPQEQQFNQQPQPQQNGQQQRFGGQPQQQGFSGNNVPVQVQGGAAGGPQPKCSCSCAY